MSRKKVNKKKKSFWSENWKGIALVALAIALGLGVPSRFWMHEAELDKEYNKLAAQGTQIEGIVTKHVLSQGSWNTKDQSPRFGIDAEIQYQDPAGQMQSISEKWPAGRNASPSDITGSRIVVYYFAGNKFVKAASRENPRLKTALKILEAKEGRNRSQPGLG